MSHQPCGRAPVHVDKFLDFVRQPHGVVYYTARLPCEIQGCKAAATNFRHVHFLLPVSHQPCGSRAPVRVDKFLDFVRQSHGVVYYTARLPYKKQCRKAAATNFRHVHFLCDLLAFSERCTTAARHTRLPQGCRKTAVRHARCSYD